MGDDVAITIDGWKALFLLVSLFRGWWALSCDVGRVAEWSLAPLRGWLDQKRADIAKEQSDGQ